MLIATVAGRPVRGPRGTSPQLIPPSQTTPILVSSPPAKGRAHEASCSVGRGAAPAAALNPEGPDPLSRRSGREGRAPARGTTPVSVGSRNPVPRGASAESARRHYDRPWLYDHPKPGGFKTSPIHRRGARQRAGDEPEAHRSPGGERNAEAINAAAGARASAQQTTEQALTERPPPPSCLRAKGRVLGKVMTRCDARAGTGNHVREFPRDRNWWAS